MSVFLSWLWVGPVPLYWTHSHLSWGWGQVSIQSADAQEQVEGLLAENNALRTSLAALEQVQDTLLMPPQVPQALLLFHIWVVWSEPHAILCHLFLSFLSVGFQPSSLWPSIPVSLAF